MTDAYVFKVTDENRAALKELAKAMARDNFRGSECKGCGAKFETDESMQGTVYWTWEKGYIGHKQCYEEAHHAV